MGGGGPLDEVQPVFPDLRMDEIEPGPQHVFGQFGGQAPAAFGGQQELRMLDLEGIVQVMEGDGPPGRVQIVHSSGRPTPPFCGRGRPR